MERGAIWVARLNPNQGREIGKTRPVIVLQPAAITDAGLPTVLVAPLTTQSRRQAQALRVAVAPRERLLKHSFICVDQVRALDRGRFGEGPLTRLTDAETTQLERALRGVLGLI